MTKLISLAKGLAFGFALMTATTTFAVASMNTAPSQVTSVPKQLSNVVPTTQEQEDLPSPSGEFESETSAKVRPTEAPTQLAWVNPCAPWGWCPQPVCHQVNPCFPYGFCPTIVCD
jgi:hypothetical protein